MRAKLIFGVLLTAALSVALMAQSAQELYQRALVQEQSNGNLQEAIKLYSQAAKAAGRDRTLAAKALIRLASCEEKLGHQAEATNAFAEVVRAYPEQREEVTIAQDRLNQLRRASSPSTQKPPSATLLDVSAVTGPLFENYCMGCHTSTANRFAVLDVGALNSRNVSENPAKWETLLLRLRARRDPPANSPRPGDKTYRTVIARLEQALDGAYAANNPLTLAERATDAEWAMRIAALIWNTPPDASLLTDAQNGRLNDPAVLNRQVVRMLRDSKSAYFVSSFLEQWLTLDELAKTSLDPAVSQADPELLRSMETEGRLFLESQLRDDRTVLELWTANYTYINDRLARHYGISGVSGRDFQRANWPDKNRAGILGMSGPLTALSLPARTSPTKRGIYVLSRYLGMNPPDPPANVPPIAEPATPRDQSTRARIMAHKVNPSCASCHAIFDPLGFALENFDAVGRWRTTDMSTPVDASGTFIDGTRFNGPVEFRAGLLKYSDAYYTNVTQQLLAHALNRKGRLGRLHDYEMPSVRAIIRSAAARDYRWSAIISGVVTSAPFRMKTLVP